MKLVLIVATVLASQAFAAGNLCSNSWSTLNSNFRVKANFPKVQFGTTFVSVDGVCVDADGEMLSTTKAYSICTEFGRSERANCVAWEKSVLTTSRTFEKELGGEHNRKGRTIVYTTPLNYSIPVGYENERGIVNACLKAYTIPTCQN
jgi:hypothetical protein